MAVQSQLDHAALNHTREKAGTQVAQSDESGAMRTEARGSTPWPKSITDVPDEEIGEKIRITDKADVLYKWHRDEKESDEPRQFVLDLIHEKLLHVQGPPLPPL